MKNSIISGTFILAVVLVASQLTQAQGTITYVSNLGDPSNGSLAVGSDSWLAAGFISGNNSGGYVLNSVQLTMTDATGNPSGFAVMLYGQSSDIYAVFPGTSLGTLSGSLDPAAAGIYTYTAPFDLMLSPNANYFIVVTAGSPIANGAYEWSFTSAPSTGYNSYHWAGEVGFLNSSDGLNWDVVQENYGQFSLNATAVPEPGVLSLLAMGGLLFVRHRRKAKAVQ